MKVDLDPITVALDSVTRQVDKQIINWLREIPPKMRRELCLTLVGPWIENKQLYVKIIPRFIKGADIKWPEI
jgi:hypothetical protein